LRVSSNPLFRTTRAVASASPSASGTGITETVPAIMLAMYWVSAVDRATGLGPRGLGPAPNPFALVTNNVRPSRATVTVVGYHAVGIRPTTRGPTAAAEGSPRSVTAPPLLPALASGVRRALGATRKTVSVRSPQLLTYAFSPVAVTATAYGSGPAGAAAPGRPVARSTARTWLARFSATSNVRPSGVIARPAG